MNGKKTVKTSGHDTTNTWYHSINRCCTPLDLNSQVGAPSSISVPGGMNEFYGTSKLSTIILDRFQLVSMFVCMQYIHMYNVQFIEQA